MPIGKILIIRGGAIGDFILTLPAITALRQQFPEAHLEVLGYPHIAQLAMAGGLVDKVQSIDARHWPVSFARNGALAKDLADYFSEFNMLILTCRPRRNLPHERFSLHQGSIYFGTAPSEGCGGRARGEGLPETVGTFGEL